MKEERGKNVYKFISLEEKTYRNEGNNKVKKMVKTYRFILRGLLWKMRKMGEIVYNKEVED